MKEKQSLIGALAHWLAAEKLESRVVLPAMEKLAGQDVEPKSLLALLEALEGEIGEPLAALARHLRATLRQEALRFYEKRKLGQRIPDEEQALLGGLALEVAGEWSLEGDPTGPVKAAVQMARQLGFLAANQAKAPQLFREVKYRTAKSLVAAHAVIAPEIQRLSLPLLKQLESAWPANVPGQGSVLVEVGKQRSLLREAWLGKAGRGLESLPEAQLEEDVLLQAMETRFAAAGRREEKARVLDWICSWPTPAAVPALRSLTREPWAQDRAMLNLTLRFGHPDATIWEDWLRWLSGQALLWQEEQVAWEQLIKAHPQGLLLILYSQRPDPEPAVCDALVKVLYESGPPIEARDLIQSWSEWIPLEEQRALLGLPAPAPAATPPPLLAEHEAFAARHGPVEPPPLLQGQSAARVLTQAQEPVPPAIEPAVPPKPSIWERHIQPFFVENWYVVAGIAMVILGSSLLAYYTWDKHWLVRYTMMPALLACFTWSLAGAGSWIERKGSEFKGTAAILRGAAIGLLPINFMAMALLSADEKVPTKAPALLAMALLYLAVFGWGLRGWCGAVEPALGNLLGATLLFLNGLVAVGPLARTVGQLEGKPLLFCLGAGFYLGFLVSAGTIVRFARKILSRQMAEEKRVPWFVAAALAVTFLQVFVWVHGFMRHLPQASTYALLVILIGWLILYAERRALELRESPQLHGGESFLGFALILLGLLMGFTQPAVRIGCFGAAGGVWMYQALSRKHPLHYWIALTLWALGAASVGLLPHYPGPWLPLLGLLLVLGFGWGSQRSQHLNQPELARACRGMEVVSLMLTAVVAPLVQWHYGSAPLATAGWLLLVAALFAWRAFQDQRLDWLHITMVILALVLPYAGFVDMAGRTAHHNTMVFGLALLSWFWLGLTRSKPTPLLLQARSTVLWFYGILAVAAMLLRVLLGDTVPQTGGLGDFMDYLGPLLMTLALIPATYYSRSLVPAAMGVVILAVLFPGLKARLQQSFAWISWGSGLGSALCGLGLLWLCFLLRPWAFLRNLPEGDRFMGKEVFPLRRHDHTLFTWPILAAVFFLLIKVDTWGLLRNLVANGVPLKTALALGITGIAWTFLGVYHRERRGAVLGVHLGWIGMLAGIGFGYWQKAAAPHWSWPFLLTGLLLQCLYWFYRFRLESTRPWARALLTEPTRQVLLVGGGALAILCTAGLLNGAPLGSVRWLYWFVTAQLVWHGLGTRRRLFGAILFFQLWIGLLAATAPGLGSLWARVSLELSLSPTLWFLLAIQLLFIALERGRSVHARLEPLLTPPFVLGSALAVLLGLGGMADGVHWLALSRWQQVLLLGTLLLTARAQGSAFVLLLAMLLGYVMVHRDLLRALGSPEEQLALLGSPWRLALLGLSMVLLAQAARRVQQRNRAWLAGLFGQGFFSAPSCGWIFWPATLFSALATLYHTFHPGLRESATQLWAPYLGAATFALVAGFWRRGGFFAGAACLLILGNVHLVRVFGGEFLRGHGLSELHLICLGLSLTLLQFSALRRVLLRALPGLERSQPLLAEAKAAQALAVINLASLGLAGLILALLSVNYFTEPNLAAITPTRFIFSGTLAWLAGWYFRRAARHPGAGEEAHIELCEALYHFGLVLAIWCAALLLPWFRHPLFTLIALGLPAAYFYLRAELGMRSGLAEARSYRNSAAVLGFVVLGLYVFKAVFHLVLFPGTPIGTQYYHYNAPLIMLLGLVLLRLHGLGGTSWLGFYGGLALMVGSYFLLTALPGLSPFDYPVPSAWCALALGHFWTLVSYARSPVRTLIQRLARLEDLAWQALRHSWGLCLLIATQGAVLWGLSDYAANTYLAAPLLAGAATMLIHQGILRRSPLYLMVAALELAVALHLDFLIPSYLPKEQVIWALLAIWLGLLVADQFLSRKLQPQTLGRIALVLAALVLAHVFYHHPWSNAGLWGMALGAILAAWNPQRGRQPANGVEAVCAALLLWIPAWLVYFSQAPFDQHGPEAALESWPILAATLTLFLIGLFARLFPLYLAAGYRSWPRSQFRLFDTTLTWLESAGPRIHSALLWLTLLIVGAAQVLHYQSAFAPREILLLALLEAGLAVTWFYEGKARQSMVAYYLMQISALACFASLRRHLMLTTGFWNYEYDVWASLACSFGLAGAKQVFDLQPRSLRVPLLTTLCLLPVLALGWVLVHGLGPNMALLVVGLHSVMFAYLGKADRESPYNLLALTGFVGFILLTFYSKLHLRAVHAYVIPVGLGVLVLQELFQRRILPEVRNWVRLATLMAMLGSAGYYALADSRYAITFNLTMIILCLLAMGLGSFLRIRLYLAMGFAGLMVDLVSILYKVLVHMERSVRMTVVGSLVLMMGAILVLGAIYYKTNKASFDAWSNQWRGRLGRWE